MHSSNNIPYLAISKSRKELLEKLEHIKHQKEKQFKEPYTEIKIPTKNYFKPHNKQEVFPEGFTSILELDKKILLSVDNIDPLVECYQTNNWIATILESDDVLKSLSKIFKLEMSKSFVELVQYYDRKYITIRSDKYYNLGICACKAAKQNKEHLVYKFIELSKSNQEKINYNKIAGGAAKCGNLSLLDNLLNLAKLDCQTFHINYDIIVKGAIKGNNEKIFDIFFELASSTNYIWNEDQIVKYASGVNTIQFYDKITNAFSGRSGCYLKAGRSGNWKILKKILRGHTEIDGNALVCAIINGNNPLLLLDILKTFSHLFFDKTIPVLYSLYKKKFDIADATFDIVKSDCDEHHLTEIASGATRMRNCDLLQKVLNMNQLLSYNTIMYDTMMCKSLQYVDLIYNHAPINYNWDFNRLSRVSIKILNLTLLKYIFDKAELTNYIIQASLAHTVVESSICSIDDILKFKEILLFLISSTCNVDFNSFLYHTIGSQNIDYLIATLEVAPTDYNWNYQRLAEVATRVRSSELLTLIAENAGEKYNFDYQTLAENAIENRAPETLQTIITLTPCNYKISFSKLFRDVSRTMRNAEKDNMQSTIANWELKSRNTLL
jgi:hypothetical protein